MRQTIDGLEEINQENEGFNFLLVCVVHKAQDVITLQECRIFAAVELLYQSVT